MKKIGKTVICFVIIGFSSHVLAETQCTVGNAGPVTLKRNERVKVCANNRFGADTVTAGIATYAAVNTREPVDLQFITLGPYEGLCVSPALPEPEKRGRKDVIIEVGVTKDAEEPFPLVVSAQRTSGLDLPIKFVVFEDKADGPDGPVELVCDP
jgi:hypothetical protein